MSYIDELSHKASLFSTIQAFCILEMRSDGLYLKPLNETMKGAFEELGFSTPANCKEFCKMWEINTCAIWKHWHKESIYSGCTIFEYYDAFIRRYLEEAFGGI